MNLNWQQDAILIVDDTPTNLKLLFEMLNNSGFKVSIAKNGESALEKVHDIIPNLILLDVMMPGIDGFETCRRLKANPKTKDIPVIFMTALADTVDKVKGLQLGAVDYITKPIEYEEVLARINVHLELRKTQLKLIQKEKMSSLGVLVAGIAHEINNPVNFISGNLSHAQRYIDDLFKLLNLYEINTSHPIPEIQDLHQEIELDFIKQDLPQVFASMLVGTSRVKKIVQALRVFSRLDESEIKSVDLHEGIDSTLMILNNRFKAKSERSEIEVIKNYTQLPLVECNAGEINQVFMNILVNAIDAIEESLMTKKDSLTENKGAIQIYTALTHNQKSAIIKISDNGIGMSQDVQIRIFDQFFTTKPVGQGTGLGLAIAHQVIVEKHRGTLEVTSVPKQGSEFIMTIPVNG
ncbi:MAG: response regulator [Scytonematopsis contorta HA4267-MV1]|jgi:signal transduction histidine kinase|nr:response regulator [Scytonematopsis contorta HA4267-MV1]